MIIAIIVACCLCSLHVQAQTFRLETVDDSLSWLVLTTDSTTDRWRLPYPVYQFQVGDVDGNGSADAMVGVIKKTRFHRENGRRLFIFKNYRGRVRPLWMGSKLGGELVDFRFMPADSMLTTAEGADRRPPLIRALETGADGRYAITDYQWEEFGMAFYRFIEKNINQTDTAYEKFHLDGPGSADEPHEPGTTTR